MLDEAQVEEQTDRLITMHEAADALLMKLARGEALSPAGVTLLRAVGFGERIDVEREVNRLKNILRHQADAGTEDERRELAAKVKAAKTKLEKEVPAIREELESTVARLQDQIDALEAAHDVPARKLEKMEQFLEHLRNPRSLPEYVRDKYGILRTNIKQSFADFREAKSIVTNRTGILKILNRLVPVLDKKVEYGHSGDPQREVHDLVTQRKLWADETADDGVHRGKANRAKVMAFKEKCEAELAEAQELIAANQEEYEGRLAEVELLRDYYVL